MITVTYITSITVLLHSLPHLGTFNSIKQQEKIMISRTRKEGETEELNSPEHRKGCNDRG